MTTHLLNLISLYLSYKRFLLLFYGEVYLINAWKSNYYYNIF